MVRNGKSTAGHQRYLCSHCRDGELLQFLSPLGWEHINLTGDYVWRQSRRLEDGKFRPLRMPGKP
ncbi:hypothetical protein AYO35_23875 (plasmid) [Escherichia coli]|nr:hypothetical protein AYO35_23875 [Escherichia coli]